MTAEFIFNAESKDRVLARLIRFIHDWPAKVPCIIEAKRFVRTRSTLQNRALWGVAYKVLSDATGHRDTELHEYFCGEFFGWEEYALLGMRKKRPRRTTTTDEKGERDVITTLRCMEFYAFIQQRAAETVQVNVPDPDPEWWKHEEKEAA